MYKTHALTLYQPMTHVSWSLHKPIGIYMGDLILDVNVMLAKPLIIHHWKKEQNTKSLLRTSKMMQD